MTHATVDGMNQIAKKRGNQTRNSASWNRPKFGNQYKPTEAIKGISADIRKQNPRRQNAQTAASHVSDPIKTINNPCSMLILRDPSNAQLTDGGPPVTPESPSCSAGPPFGEAVGWPPHCTMRASQWR